MTGAERNSATPLSLLSAGPALMFNHDQWNESFEGQLSILRSHRTQRPLSTMSLQAWHKYGRVGEDPVEAAKAWSVSLDRKGPPK